MFGPTAEIELDLGGCLAAAGTAVCDGVGLSQDSVKACAVVRCHAVAFFSLASVGWF